MVSLRYHISNGFSPEKARPAPATTALCQQSHQSQQPVPPEIERESALRYRSNINNAICCSGRQRTPRRQLDICAKLGRVSRGDFPRVINGQIHTHTHAEAAEPIPRPRFCQNSPQAAAPPNAAADPSEIIPAHRRKPLAARDSAILEAIASAFLLQSGLELFILKH